MSWFDLVAIAMIVVGVVVGRKRGMSSELLDAVQWLLIVFLGAMFYDPLGRMLADAMGAGAVVSYILAYVLVAVGVFLVFLGIKKMVGEKLVSGDVFGGFEYYLGMTAGVVRFLCILFCALALLNAKQVSDQELAAQIKAQDESLGSIYFPPFGSIQRAVFQTSLSGRFVKEYLSAQLINVDPSAGGGGGHEGIGRRREREVYEVMDPKR